MQTLFFSIKHCLQNFSVCSFLGHFFGNDVIYLTIHKCLFMQKLTLETPLARVISLRFASFSACKVCFKKVSTFMILDFKLPFLALLFIEKVVGKVVFLTLLGILGFLMLVRTGQLVSLSQSKLEV